ncbi:phage portal protein, HK97 family [Arachidicoccus rhizosphaerae]|uniref:Phage portal protein, HK97 family n=1 Tax=Arachidicoccus rhizosphaerae TaxID=551991 RepID=A0A1H4CF77_9BACT|nr:phage portal protein [Arachidicoccus rhizosphaerae]SEA58969.1 phage portal protein, HK97 family [Arachidicoccus rhizosphaerae]
MNQVERLKTNFQKYGKFYPTVLDKVKSFLPHEKWKGPDGATTYWNTALSIPNMDKELFVNSGYLKNAMVYSVVNKIAKTGSQAPLQPYKVVNEKAYQKYKSLTHAGMEMTKDVMFSALLERSKAFELLPESHELSKLLQNPNRQQGQTEFIRNALGMKLITGDAFIYGITIGRKKRVGELIVLPSHMMTIIPEEGKMIPGPLRYEFSYGGNVYRFNPDEILQSKYWNPKWDVLGSQLYGLSPLHAGWLSVQSDNDARLAGIELLQNRGPRGFVSWELPPVAGNTDLKAVTKEAAGRIKEEWRQLSKEYKDQLAIIFGKATWMQTGLTNTDMGILDTSKFTQSDLCNLYGVSEKLFNNPDDSKFNNLKEYKKDFISNVVAPELFGLRDDLNRKLKTDWGYKDENVVIDFDISVYKELDEDKKELAAWMDIAGCFTENEKRIILGQDALDYDPEGKNLMDKVYKKNSYLPIEKLGQIQPQPGQNDEESDHQGNDPQTGKKGKKEGQNSK